MHSDEDEVWSAVPAAGSLHYNAASDALFMAERYCKATTRAELEAHIMELLVARFNMPNKRGVRMIELNRRFGQQARHMGLHLRSLIQELYRKGTIKMLHYKDATAVLPVAEYDALMAQFGMDTEKQILADEAIKAHTFEVDPEKVKQILAVASDQTEDGTW